MPEFNNHGPFTKDLPEPDQVLSVFIVLMKPVRELDKQRTEFSSLLKKFEDLTEGNDFFSTITSGFMAKSPVQFYGKLEPWVMQGALDPILNVPCFRNSIKC